MHARLDGPRWPAADLQEGHATLVDEHDERVLDGIDRRSGARVVVSMRDLGADVSAAFWDEELARLVHVQHPSAARVLGGEVVDDRFFVVRTKIPTTAVPLTRRLAPGLMDAPTALQAVLASLEVAVELHALGLSAAGIRVRSMMEMLGPEAQPTLLVTTFGLHVDNDVEVFNDLRELALRVIAWAGGRHEHGALTIPEGRFTREIEGLLRRAVGIDRPAFQSAREMLDALTALSGSRRRRGSERVSTTTRPIAQATTVFGSNLLLAEEFVSAGAREEAPAARRRTP